MPVDSIGKRSTPRGISILRGLRHDADASIRSGTSVAATSWLVGLSWARLKQEVGGLVAVSGDPLKDITNCAREICNESRVVYKNETH